MLYVILRGTGKEALSAPTCDLYCLVYYYVIRTLCAFIQQLDVCLSLVDIIIEKRREIFNVMSFIYFGVVVYIYYYIYEINYILYRSIF